MTMQSTLHNDCTTDDVAEKLCTSAANTDRRPTSISRVCPTANFIHLAKRARMSTAVL